MTGYIENTRTEPIKSLGLNYYFTNKYRIGISYQHYNNEYSYSIFNDGTSYTDDFFGTPDVSSYEANFSIIFKKSFKKFQMN